MEGIHRQIQQVLPRVLSSAELRQANTPERQALYWCAKEALYKLYGKRALDFRTDMKISEPWPGQIQGLVTKNEQSHQTKIYAKHYEQYIIALAIAD
jgi:phosphopantetheinyl transferase (holo-ACP synthase)